MAFYGLGLQGWDASFHFIQSGTRLGDGWPGMSSYATDTPAYLGQFSPRSPSRSTPGTSPKRRSSPRGV